MSSDWTCHIRQECVGSEARFELPVRPLDPLRLVGVGVTVVGVVFVVWPLGWLWQIGRKVFEGWPEPAEIMPVVFLLVFVAAGSVPLLLGLAILFGRCLVEWKDGQLHCTEIIGAFRWHRRVPPKPIRRLVVGAASTQIGNAASRERQVFAVLQAQFDDGSKKVVVLGYPKDWLVGLAHELCGYIGAKPVVISTPAVGGAESAPGGGDETEPLDQPAASNVQLDEHATGLRLVVPPAGVQGVSKGLFLFGLLWCGFMIVFTAGMATSALKNNKIEWGLAAFVIGFWAVGLGMLAAAINMGRRTATLTVAGGRLCVETKGLFGAKRLEWHRSELAAIPANASGMKVSNRPVIELQIHTVAGKKIGLLAGRDEAALRWMANCLGRALQLPAR